MRCLGLTAERRRCRVQVTTAASYCEQHRREFDETCRRPEFAQGAGRGSGWLRMLRPGRAEYVVPDDAKFSIPSWLRKSSTEEVIDHLLHDPNMLTRWMAAFTLRMRRSPVAVDPLWQVLQRDPVSLVRQQAAVALGKIGMAPVIGPLVEALWHDPDAGVRQASAIALGNLGYPLATEHLIAALEREPAVFVRWDCVLALGQVGDRAIEPQLTVLASQERSDVVRRACHEALAEIRRRV